MFLKLVGQTDRFLGNYRDCDSVMAVSCNVLACLETEFQKSNEMSTDSCGNFAEPTVAALAAATLNLLADSLIFALTSSLSHALSIFHSHSLQPPATNDFNWKSKSARGSAGGSGQCGRAWRCFEIVTFQPRFFKIDQNQARQRSAG